MLKPKMTFPLLPCRHPSILRFVTR